MYWWPKILQQKGSPRCSVWLKLRDHRIYSNLNAGLEQFCLKLKENSKVNVSQSTMQMLWIKASKGTKVPLITSERFFKISSPRKRTYIYIVMLNHHLYISSNHLFSRWIQPLAPCQGVLAKDTQGNAASCIPAKINSVMPFKSHQWSPLLWQLRFKEGLTCLFWMMA